jgi:hypothetical protein
MSLNPELSKRKTPMKRKGEDRERKREIKSNSGSTNRNRLFPSSFLIVSSYPSSKVKTSSAELHLSLPEGCAASKMAR